MNDHHILVAKKNIRGQIEKHSGETIKVEIDLDKAPRVVALPKEFLDPLTKTPHVKTVFEKLSYSHQKEFAEWIHGAEKVFAKERRALKTIDMISLGTRFKS